MAIVNLRNATVQRIFHDGKGVAVYESFESRGEQRKSYYTAWFDTAPTLEVGDIINLSGLLSVKEREYEKEGEKRRSIDVSLNSARLETGTQTTAVAATSTADDDWAQSANYSDEVPF